MTVYPAYYDGSNGLLLGFDDGLVSFSAPEDFEASICRDHSYFELRREQDSLNFIISACLMA